MNQVSPLFALICLDIRKIINNYIINKKKYNYIKSYMFNYKITRNLFYKTRY